MTNVATVAHNRTTVETTSNPNGNVSLAVPRNESYNLAYLGFGYEGHDICIDLPGQNLRRLAADFLLSEVVPSRLPWASHVCQPDCRLSTLPMRTSPATTA